MRKVGSILFIIAFALLFIIALFSVIIEELAALFASTGVWGIVAAAAIIIFIVSIIVAIKS